MKDGVLWSAMPTPALILDAGDRVEDINPAAEGFLNASVRSVRGRHVWDVLSIDAPLDEAFERARGQDTPLFVSDVDLGSGTRSPVRCNLSVSPLGAGQAGRLIMITPLDASGRITRGHSSRASAKSAIGMAEMLAHEIKNPLAGITGAAQLMSMNLGAEDHELADLIVSECHRIVALLDQVEQFGNVQPPQLGCVNLHDTLDRAKRSAELGFAANMTILEDYDPSLPQARADRDQLLQVILNLLKNAAEAAGRDGGAITLRTYYEHALRVRHKDGPGHALPLQIEIEDDGPGLPPEIAGDVFDPFVSGRENGTGLGLALAAKIIADQEGWISVTSVPGRTVFRVSLPVAPAHMKEDD